MTAYVFVGPTLGSDALPQIPGLIVLPPAAQGDVYRVAQSRPRAIGIIDGYFEGVPSVWHKEILWAMDQGIHVFGSASLGALRAAEIHGFGMRGVGLIFAAYCDGILPPYHDEPFEDDDEVTVIHGPAETGYLALSEAMVNMRCTLAKAETAGVMAAETRQALIGLAKGLFYQDRTYDHLLARAAEQLLLTTEIESFRAWLPDGRVDQKREDALAMLAEMQALLESDVAPMQVNYDFEWTEMWEDATAASSATRAIRRGESADWLLTDRILEELRLDPDAYNLARDRTLLRFLARREANRRRQPVDLSAQREVLERLRTRHGLFRRVDFDRWLQTNDIAAERLDQLLEDEAHLQGVASLVESALGDQLLDDLRLRGDYRRLAERAREKQELLVPMGLDQPKLGDGGVTPTALLAWYFERQLNRSLPDDVETAARELGFDSRDHFYRVVLREWLYCRERRSSPQT